MPEQRRVPTSRPHPWHGLPVGPGTPGVVHAFIEITPFDLVKYEIDKASGFLRVDRPQRTSALPPTPYGFVPRTYCGEHVCAIMDGATRGDGDPLDICVISERMINRAETLLTARVIGGLPMLDGGEADDKLVAVLDGDLLWGGVEDLDDLPSALVERLVHYFSTYKWSPGTASRTTLGEPYGRAHALRVLDAAVADYDEAFG
ncbi:MAG: inorganic pyrophosphatase [Planctomycetota bacterium]